jgi:hypothetical protein
MGERTIQFSGSTTWPKRGKVSVNAHDISAGLFQDFIGPIA